MKFIYGGLLAYVLLSTSVNAATSNTVQVLGPQGINLWKLQRARASESASSNFRKQSYGSFVVQDPNKVQAAARADGDYPERWFEQPLDHFNKSNTATFKQRYWVNDKHYKPGSNAPVIVLDGGETSGTDRLNYLDVGIVDILAKATGGVGVVLEHRYYGTSIPVPDFSTDNLRWLDNDQAAADSANFMASVKFDGISEDLTAPKTPWIYYGGSYAGARAAHMAVLYPELTYGAIASSGVTHAALTNWEYMEVIRRYAPKNCSAALQGGIEVIDDLLDNKKTNPVIRGLFNLTGLAHDDDFASIIETPLEYWQSKVWGEYDDPTFDQFCADLVAPPTSISSHASTLPFGHPKRQVKIGKNVSVDYTIVNYATWMKDNVVSSCSGSQEDCFGTYNDAAYQDTGLDQDWRLWTFQVCTQWGYFTTVPPDPHYPRIISRRLTLDYESKICKQAYPPGKYFTVPNTPNLTAVNALGDFGIARDRLAIIDGEVDPWRPDTPHSQFYAKPRPDTITRPFKLIPGAVHHWDEWGLANSSAEPPEIQKIHKEMVGFVTAWLKDFKPPKA